MRILNLSLFCALMMVACSAKRAPHILMVLVDDYGWGDVGWHGYGEIPTPNMDRLASEGVILNHHYSQYQCTPSRVALMTAKYPMRLGLQHSVLVNGERRGVPLGEKFMPQYLKEQGYSTHAVGKWHLGYFTAKHTPTHRGFDTWFGFYSGANDYYNYTSTHQVPPTHIGFDLWESTPTQAVPQWSRIGQYATYVFTDKIIERIQEHDTEKPFFMYYAAQAPHKGNLYDPEQAPPNLIGEFDYINNTGRRKYAAMIKAFDDGIGDIMDAFRERGMDENLVVVLASDNGGQGPNVPTPHSNNWPLRGTKATVWEGGVRSLAFVWSPLLKQTGYVNNRLYHLTDWLPTFYRLADGKEDFPDDIDGHDIWKSISEDKPSPRTEVMIQVNPIGTEYAIRRHQYKLIYGRQPYPGGLVMDQWYLPDGGLNDSYISSPPGRIVCNTSLTPYVACDPTVAPCLYNVINDPCEYTNIAAQHPALVESLLARIVEFNSTSTVIWPSGATDPLGAMNFTGGVVKPWLAEVEGEYVSLFA